ncbi:MAG: hypothetical protein H6732_08000 [Alphaproteobacteria bacterium]|nr:hypothetical protein [Alphaproteobacteria bacterium]
MSTASERRKAAARQKHKERRQARQSERKARTKAPRTGTRDAGGWPLGDAWLSQDWFEPEARLHAVVSRVHDDGSAACAAFEVDLAEEGLVATRVRGGLRAEHVPAFAADQDPEGTLIVTEPEAVARLVLDGLAWRRRAGLPDPKGLDEALALLEGVDPDESAYDFHFGLEGQDEPTEEIPRQGLFTRLKGLFGG